MDGRRAQELRSLEISLSPHTASSTSLVPASAGAVGQPDGAAKVDQGLSSVLVYVYGPREPVKVNRIVSQRTDKASINVEVATAPWGSTEWRHRSHGERRVVELANAIRSTFEPVLLTHQFPRSQVNIVVEVLQQDGSVLPTAINACTLALMDAGIPMIDYVTSLTCGLYGSTALLDLNGTEERDLPYLTLAVQPRSGKVPLLQLDTRVHVDRFESMVDIAVQAGSVLRDELEAAMRGRTARLVQAMTKRGEAAEAGGEMDDR